MDNKQKVRKNLSVVVLEDNDGDFLLLEDCLIEAYSTIKITRYETFNDFMQLIETKTDVSFDLLLLDLHLPDQSGMQLIEKVLSIKLLIPVIILTGYAELSLANKSLEMGVYDFLIKDDINPTLLKKSIEFTVSRNNFVHQIKIQNKQLKDIAWTQSHVVRAPLSRILGIINMIETLDVNDKELLFWIDHLKSSSQEMDEIVKTIVAKTETLHLKK